MYLPLLIITLNLVPAQVSEFSLQLATLEPGLGAEPNPEMTIVRSLIRKEMGWVEKDGTREYQIEEAKLILTDDKGKRTFDLSKFLGVKKNPNWQALQRIHTPQLERMFGGIEQKLLGITPPLDIQRKPDGVNFLLQRGKGKVLLGRATWKLDD